MIKYFFIFLLSITVVNSHADFSELSKRDKLIKLAEYEKIRETIMNYKDSCIEKMKDLNPDSIVKTQPNYFGGINPNSKKWPKVKVAFNIYLQTSCNCLNENDVIDKYLSIYTPLFSNKALDTILNFYSTPEGQEYLRITNIGKIKLQDYYNEVYAQNTKKSMKIYYEELKTIVESK